MERPALDLQGHVLADAVEERLVRMRVSGERPHAAADADRRWPRRGATCAVLELQLRVQDVVDPGRVALAHLVVGDVGAVGQDVVAGEAVGAVEVDVGPPPERQLLRRSSPSASSSGCRRRPRTRRRAGRPWPSPPREGYSSPSMPMRVPWTLCSLMPSSMKREEVDRLALLDLALVGNGALAVEEVEVHPPAAEPPGGDDVAVEAGVEEPGSRRRPCS